MTNELECLCEASGIKVEFISNKFIETGDEANQGYPVIRVHRVFKECPARVAAALLEVFTEESNTSECIGIIEGYLKEKFGPVGIRVHAPKAVIKRFFHEEISIPLKDEESNYYIDEEVKEIKQETYYIDEDNYTEAQIFTINAEGRDGHSDNLHDNGTLSLKADDIMELDIIVNPPLHK